MRCSYSFSFETGENVSVSHFASYIKKNGETGAPYLDLIPTRLNLIPRWDCELYAAAERRVISERVADPAVHVSIRYFLPIRIRNN